MKTVSISLDVWCEYSHDRPAYRVYVDNDLLAERDFIWSSHSQFIKEHIEVNVNSGEHSVRIINLTPEIANFRIDNLQVDGRNTTILTQTTAKFVV